VVSLPQAAVGQLSNRLVPLIASSNRAEKLSLAARQPGVVSTAVS
jgi:hypothetical protein